jgi:hypothetical protein
MTELFCLTIPLHRDTGTILCELWLPADITFDEVKRIIAFVEQWRLPEAGDE